MWYGGGWGWMLMMGSGIKYGMLVMGYSMDVFSMYGYGV